MSWEKGVLLFGVTEDPAEERELSFRRFRESVSCNNTREKHLNTHFYNHTCPICLLFRGVEHLRVGADFHGKKINRLQHP